MLQHHYAYDVANTARAYKSRRATVLLQVYHNRGGKLFSHRFQTSCVYVRPLGYKRNSNQQPRSRSAVPTCVVTRRHGAQVEGGEGSSYGGNEGSKCGASIGKGKRYHEDC
jgi:hypothetical protein